MKTIVRAFAPGNISLLFQVVPGVSPETTGSKGIGFTIREGASVTVRKALTDKITYNGRPMDLPTVTSTLRRLTRIPLSVSIRTPLPLGSGFGMSGASAIATAYAANALLELHKTNRQLAHIAHCAEVENKTGLGDVVNQYYGGFFVKLVTSARFVARKLPIDQIPVYCRSHGKLLTSSILNNQFMVGKINTRASSALKQIQTLQSGNKQLTFADITHIANTFTRKTGLLTDNLEEEIHAIEKRGGHAAMILLGDAIVSNIPFPKATKLHMDSARATLL